MNRHILHIAFATTALLLASCGKKADQKPEEAPATVVVVEQDQLRDAVKNHDHKNLKSMADQLALNADDLTPAKAVSVLMSFYDLHLQYAAEHKRRSDMETIRKFVDVYDIVNSNHGADFRRSLEATREVYPDVDFTQVYREFVEKLSQYDGAVLSDSAPVAEPDSAATDTLADELPPELRPAE